MSLDINLFREDRGGVPQVIRQSQKKRFADIAMVDQVIALDQAWREKQFAVTKAQSSLGSIVKEIAAKKKKNETFEDLVRQTKGLQIDIDAAQEREEAARVARDTALRQIPNIIHPSVPSSQKESDKTVLRSYQLSAETTSADNRLSYGDILYMLNGCDLDKAGAVSGRKSAFLFGPCVALTQALVSAGLHHLIEFGDCTLIECPSIMGKEFADQFLEPNAKRDRCFMSLVKDDEQRYLVAALEPLFALRKDEWISEPITSYAGVAKCFRPPSSREMDAHGLFGAHQMDKVVHFTMCDPELSWHQMDEMLALAEQFFQKLELPYRVTIPVSTVIPHSVAKQYDIECYCIALGDFVPLCSIRHYTDFYSREQNIRFGFKKQGELAKKFAHIVESTLVVSTQLLCVLLETHQRAEGVAIPPHLRAHAPLLLLPSDAKVIPYVKNAPPCGKKQKKGNSSHQAPGTPAVTKEPPN